MDIRLNLWFLRHRLDYVFGHVAGMGRSESNSFDAVNCRHGFEQCAEAELLVAIGVYGLAEQDDFFDSAGSQLRISRRMSPAGMLRSRPRTYGTTQKAQNLSHPRITVTYARTPLSYSGERSA